MKGQMSAAANRNKFLPTKADTKGSERSRVTFRKRGACRRERERKRKTVKVRVSRPLSLPALSPLCRSKGLKELLKMSKKLQ